MNRILHSFVALVLFSCSSNPPPAKNPTASPQALVHQSGSKTSSSQRHLPLDSYQAVPLPETTEAVNRFNAPVESQISISQGRTIYLGKFTYLIEKPDIVDGFSLSPSGILSPAILKSPTLPIKRNSSFLLRQGQIRVEKVPSSEGKPEKNSPFILTRLLSNQMTDSNWTPIQLQSKQILDIREFQSGRILIITEECLDECQSTEVRTQVFDSRGRKISRSEKNFPGQYFPVVHTHDDGFILIQKNQSPTRIFKILASGKLDRRFEKNQRRPFIGKIWRIYQTASGRILAEGKGKGLGIAPLPGIAMLDAQGKLIEKFKTEINSTEIESWTFKRSQFGPFLLEGRYSFGQKDKNEFFIERFFFDTAGNWIPI